MSLELLALLLNWLPVLVYILTYFRINFLACAAALKWYYTSHFYFLNARNFPSGNFVPAEHWQTIPTPSPMWTLLVFCKSFQFHPNTADVIVCVSFCHNTITSLLKLSICSLTNKTVVGGGRVNDKWLKVFQINDW